MLDPARAAVPGLAGLAPADGTVPFPADPVAVPTPSAAAPVPPPGTSPSSQPGHSQRRVGHPVPGTDRLPGESGPSCGCGDAGGSGEGAGGACPDALEGAGGASESSGLGWQGEGRRIKLARYFPGGSCRVGFGEMRLWERVFREQIKYEAARQWGGGDSDLSRHSPPTDIAARATTAAHRRAGAGGTRAGKRGCSGSDGAGRRQRGFPPVTRDGGICSHSGRSGCGSTGLGGHLP